MFYKLVGILYTLTLKLIYLNRIKLKGIISPEGFITIKIDKNAKLTILGNITLRAGSQILVRENATCQIGSGVFFNRNCSVVCREDIMISENVLIGESVKIYDNDHKVDESKIYKDKFLTKRIIIDKNVWVGNDVNILKGSEILQNSIIGSMSLVKSKLPVSGVYVGVPVRLLSERQ